MVDLDQGATKRDLLDLRTATQQDIANLRTATQEDIANLRTATQEDIANLRTNVAEMRVEIIRHFDVVAEEMKAAFTLMFDVARAETAALAGRIEVVEGQDQRIDQLDLRVTRLERTRT